MESYYAKQLECLCSQVRPGDREAMEAQKALEQNCEASGRSGAEWRIYWIKSAGVVRSEKLCLERKLLWFFVRITVW